MARQLPFKFISPDSGHRRGASLKSVLDYPITSKSAKECIAETANYLKKGTKGNYLVCACPHSLEVARHDDIFDNAIMNASLIIPDGIGILLASKIQGGDVRERITGYDIFLGLSKALNSKSSNSRYFFLGSSMETLVKIKNRMELDFTNIKIAGIYSPPFKSEFSDEDNRLMVEAINNANPDVLWVGMTAPKQEKWIYQHRDKLDVKFLAAIGAVFDFYAGNKKKAPPAIQKIGLEWAYRFVQEPRRMWRRNMISTPKFIFNAIQSKSINRYR